MNSAQSSWLVCTTTLVCATTLWASTAGDQERADMSNRLDEVRQLERNWKADVGSQER